MPQSVAKSSPPMLAATIRELERTMASMFKKASAVSTIVMNLTLFWQSPRHFQLADQLIQKLDMRRTGDFGDRKRIDSFNHRMFDVSDGE